MPRALLLVVCLAAGFAATASAPQRAWACSCAQPDPAALLAEADGAFVGVFLDRRLTNEGVVRASDDPAIYRFRVEQALKGTLPPTIEVVSAADSASCGLETAEGQRVGLVLSREGGRWRSGLCHQLDGAALASVGTPGEGRIATREEAARGFGRASALAAVAFVAVAAGLFLIQRRYRPD